MLHEPSDDTAWTLGQRLLFRFALVYFVLYAAPLPTAAWTPIVSWVGTALVGLPRELFHIGSTGSGDTSFKVLRTAIIAVFAVVAALAWSVVDRRRRHHRTLLWWLEVGCRVYLAQVMLSYGYSKVFRLQFQEPMLERLLTPYGSSSPMGLAWTFMGHSKAYTIFSGLGEVIGGTLVLFRRTMTLGALVIVAVMTNVVMLNMAYDVPVKLFSGHLLVFALALTARDARRLAAVLVLNRPAAPRVLVPPGRRPWLRRIAPVAAFALFGYWTFTNVRGSLAAQTTWGERRPKTALHGLYDVETYAVDGEAVPPLLTDPDRWKHVVIERPGLILTWLMTDERVYYGFRVHEDRGTFTLMTSEDPLVVSEWTYEETEPGRLVFAGDLEGDAVEVTLVRRPEDAMLLRSRGFRWISEYPFNR